MKQNLDLLQHLDKVLSVVARNDAGARLNLTGLTGTAITWKLARETTRDADNSAEITYSIGNGVALTDAAQGEFSITIEGTDLNDLVGYWRHECLVTVGGVTFRPLFGNATINRDIE